MFSMHGQWRLITRVPKLPYCDPISKSLWTIRNLPFTGCAPAKPNCFILLCLHWTENIKTNWRTHTRTQTQYHTHPRDQFCINPIWDPAHCAFVATQFHLTEQLKCKSQILIKLFLLNNSDRNNNIIITIIIRSNLHIGFGMLCLRYCWMGFKRVVLVDTCHSLFGLKMCAAVWRMHNAKCLGCVWWCGAGICSLV